MSILSLTIVTMSLGIDPQPALANPASARKAVVRGLEFLKKDAATWKQEHKCSTCHHGTMTVWALSEAKSQGYAVAAESLAEIATWAKERLATIDQPRDKRPGWNMVSSPAVYLAVMAVAVPTQDVVTTDELRRIAGHLARHQEADGSWAWSLAPAKNRPQPFFESDEVVTRLAFIALGSQVPVDPKEPSTARANQDKAAIWLRKAELGDSTQSNALRLFMNVRTRASEQVRQADIEQLLTRQNKDGGWGQLTSMPSDAYATGQALYFLQLAGVKPEREALQRAVSFLLANQRDDGSWPMTSRTHPGEKTGKFLIPITYFGSAWATIGLARAVPAE